MNGAMLYFGKAVLYFVVNSVRDFMSVVERKIAVRGNLHFDVEAVAELSRADKVESQNAVQRDYKLLYFSFGGSVARGVRHFVDTLFEYGNDYH